MRPIRTVRADLSAPFESLGTLLSRHRAATRVSLVALSFTLIIPFSQQAATQAGPEPQPLVPESLLPQSIGVGIDTASAVTIPFETAMDPSSVEGALQLLPEHKVSLEWNADHTALTVDANRLWRTDESYLVILGASATDADGNPLGDPERYAFTTETAPTVSDFQVKLAAADLPEPADAQLTLDALAEHDAGLSPTSIAHDVSAATAITVSFAAEMDRADVEEHFAITPDVAGDLSWRGGNLVFTPSERLTPGGRYTISVIGAHDDAGNVLGGDANFSFVVRAGAQLSKTRPRIGETGVDSGTVQMWFTQPMDVDAMNKALRVTDAASGDVVAGSVEWNAAETQLTFTPDAAFAAGTNYRIELVDGAVDADGNPITAGWSFTTAAAPAVPPAPAEAAAPAPVRATSTTTTRSAPAIPPPAPASSAAGYALNQINASRAAYGFAPLVLDSAISAVAYAHAYDQAANGYFSHTGLNGSSRQSRLAAGGVSFGWSGENQCYLVGRSVTATLDWCHAQFMAEPYPGHWNHIANILSPNARRVGVGIAQVGAKIVIVWDFTD